MKKNIFKVILFSLLLVPVSIQFGQIEPVHVSVNTVFAQSGKTTTKTPPVEVKLNNPLGTVDDIPNLVKAILEIALKIGVPIIALAIIYTGYLFIAAQGNPEKLQKAKESFVYVFIGSMILLGAYVIAESIVNTVNAVRGV